MANINWMKIVGNTGLAFFNSMIALVTLKSLMELQIGLKEFLIFCAFISILQGGAAFFREFTKHGNPPEQHVIDMAEDENVNTRNPQPKSKIKSKIHYCLKNMTI